MKEYDENSIDSILKYAQKLENQTLAGICSKKLPLKKGKGGFGQMLEEFYFGYKPNSNANADFESVGLELKTSPLKKVYKKKKTSTQLVSKERLVCCMLNYEKDYSLSFRDSHLWNKIAKILLVFYLYEKGLPMDELEIQKVYLYLLENRENDLITIEKDYYKIIDKIKNGEAHKLSEGETDYLGVVRKGSGGVLEKKVAQPFSSEMAYKKAFCLKSGYMKTLWEQIESKKEIESVIDSDELRRKGLSGIIIDRVSPYFGKTSQEIADILNIPNSKAKNAKTLISKAIFGDTKNKENELTKLGLKLKTIRVRRSNKRPFEAMSFPAFNYAELAQEEVFEDSSIYNYFTMKYLFLVYEQENKEDKNNAVLKYAILWSMPSEDLLDAESFWKDTREKVRQGDYSHFWRCSECRKFHVRPHATKKNKYSIKTPDGSSQEIKSAWFNIDYVQSIVKSYIALENKE